MRIPVEELAPETLANLVESYVLREGTDYGELEIDLKQKVEQVCIQLKAGEAVLLYSELHETVNIVSLDEFKQMQASGEDQETAPDWTQP